jgi:hypothetical protein
MAVDKLSNQMPFHILIMYLFVVKSLLVVNTLALMLTSSMEENLQLSQCNDKYLFESPYAALPNGIFYL